MTDQILVLRREPADCRDTAWTVTPDGKKLIIWQWFGTTNAIGSFGAEIAIHRDAMKYSTCEVELRFDEGNAYPFEVEISGKTVTVPTVTLRFEGGNEELPRLVDWFRLLADVLDGQMTDDPEHPWSLEHLAAVEGYVKAIGQVVRLDENHKPKPKTVKPKRSAFSQAGERERRFWQASQAKDQ